MDKSETKVVYEYDDNKIYQGQKILDWTDRSPISGAWQIPAGCTEITPPEDKDGFDIIWNGTSWEYQEKAAEPEDPTMEMTDTEPNADVQLQLNANAAKQQLQQKAVNAMMIQLAGGDTSQIQAEYQNALETMSDDVAAQIPDVFPAWAVNRQYKKDAKLNYNNVLYKVLQTHTSDLAHVPDTSSELYTPV